MWANRVGLTLSPGKDLTTCIGETTYGVSVTRIKELEAKQKLRTPSKMVVFLWFPIHPLPSKKHDERSTNTPKHGYSQKNQQTPWLASLLLEQPIARFRCCVRAAVRGWTGTVGSSPRSCGSWPRIPRLGSGGPQAPVDRLTGRGGRWGWGGMEGRRGGPCQNCLLCFFGGKPLI